MRHLVTATRQAVAQQNWYAALTLALTLPDICGRLLDPKKISSARYQEWFDQYLKPLYETTIAGEHVTFLSAGDCYALRCAFLHQGEFGIDDKKSRTALARFHLTTPPGIAGSVHLNLMNDALQLQIDRFCYEICDAVDRWIEDTSTNAEVQQRMASLGHIYSFNNSIILDCRTAKPA